MKLKRVWTAICIYVLFIIFDVVMVASSGFFSGLFPSDKALPYTAVFTVLSVAVMGVLTFVLGKISDNIDTAELSHAIFAKLIYVLMLITILFGSIVYRYDVLARTTAAPNGKLSLYENAQVGAFITSNEQDLLSILYSKLLNLVLIFTGNRITFALFFQLAIFVLFILCGSIAARLLLGKAASVVFAAYLAFMPVFSDNLMYAKLGTDELFYFLFGIELLILAIYLKVDSDEGYESKAWGLWYIFVGVMIGFMTYVDAGTLIVVLPLLLSGLFILRNSVVSEFFRLLFIIVGGLTTFFGMIFQEGGSSGFDAVLYNWSHYFFKNINTFNTFWTYTNYKIEYLVTFVAMSGVIVGFWRNRRYEKISPWLLSTMIIFFATPFFGATRTNSEIMLTVFFAYVLGAVASLLTMESQKESLLAEIDVKEDEDSEGTIPATAPYPEHLVVRPDNVKEAASEEDEALDKDKEPAPTEDETPENGEPAPTEDDTPDVESETSHIEEDDNSDEYYDADDDEVNESEEASIITDESEESDEIIVDEESHPQNVVDSEEIHSQNTAFNGYAARYVPEGMVLPMGAEDEMDISESHMKMPEFKGTISLNRGKETSESALDNSPKAIQESEPVSEPVRKDKNPGERVDDILEQLLAEKLAKDKRNAVQELHTEQKAEPPKKVQEEPQAPTQDRFTAPVKQSSYEKPIQPKVNKPVKQETNTKPTKKYQYEFDIALKPGDDFDIK